MERWGRGETNGTGAIKVAELRGFVYTERLPGEPGMFNGSRQPVAEVAVTPDAGDTPRAVALENQFLAE
jgi:hypothetical protein